MQDHNTTFTGENYPSLLMTIEQLECLTKKLQTHTASFQSESEFVDHQNNKTMFDHFENYKLLNTVDFQNFSTLNNNIESIIRSSKGVNVLVENKRAKNAWDFGFKYTVTVYGAFAIVIEFDKNVSTSEIKEVSASISIEDEFISLLRQKGVNEDWVRSELDKFVQHEFVTPFHTLDSMAFKETLIQNVPLTEKEEEIVRLLNDN